MRTDIYSTTFSHSFLSFALLSISVLCVAVWSSILFKLCVLTEERRKCGEEGRHPAEGPSWAAPVECSACEFSAYVHKIGVDGSQPHMWPLHCRGHKARQVTWGHMCDAGVWSLLKWFFRFFSTTYCIIEQKAQEQNIKAMCVIFFFFFYCLLCRQLKSLEV